MKALVLEDEPPARRELCRQLKKLGVAEVFEAASVKAALDILSDQAIDVLFLDIEMPKGGGFELLATQPAQDIPAIFVTAHAEHAARAFDWQATDYLLKPVKEERLLEALGRLKTRGEEKKFTAEDRVLFRDAGKNHFLRIGDIKLLESSGAYTRVVHTGGSLTANGTLSRLLERIDEKVFVRANRTQAVNP
ncbi:MAG: LytR/AlgR family response regulator transcription factor [Chthoniobacterales bacterium]